MNFKYVFTVIRTRGTTMTQVFLIISTFCFTFLLNRLCVSRPFFLAFPLLHYLLHARRQHIRRRKRTNEKKNYLMTRETWDILGQCQKLETGDMRRPAGDELIAWRQTDRLQRRGGEGQTVQSWAISWAIGCENLLPVARRSRF